MFKQKTILAIIAARGGSKGVLRKNIRMVGGKPLIAWIIEAAKQSSFIDRLILSCDDREIIEVAKEHGCEVPFVRPEELAMDDSSVSDVILHAIEEMPDYDYIMLLQPTSPLTQNKDIDGCIKFIVNTNNESVISVSESNKSPYWMFSMNTNNRLKPVMGGEYLNYRRQDLPLAYIPTGAVYIAKLKWFLKNRSFYSTSTAGYKISIERSLDIDTERDLKLVEAVINNA